MGIGRGVCGHGACIVGGSVGESSGSLWGFRRIHERVREKREGYFGAWMSGGVMTMCSGHGDLAVG